MTHLWLVGSVAAIVTGATIAITAPNGYPGVILTLLGVCLLGVWLERERT